MHSSCMYQNRTSVFIGSNLYGDIILENRVKIIKRYEVSMMVVVLITALMDKTVSTDIPMFRNAVCWVYIALNDIECVVNVMSVEV